ncbi:alphaK I8, partial [Puccinia sorghi]
HFLWSDASIARSGQLALTLLAGVDYVLFSWAWTQTLTLPFQLLNPTPSTSSNLLHPNISSLLMKHPQQPSKLLLLIPLKLLFLSIGKAKCHKNRLPAPYSKSKKDKPSSSSSNEKSSNHIMINDGIDPQDPNLYAHLKHQLWEMLSPELIKKSLVITPLPTNPLSQITLSHGESHLPNLQTLLSYISKARRKPIPIDNIYEEPNDINQIKPLNQSLISVFSVHKDKPLMVGMIHGPLVQWLV